MLWWVARSTALVALVLLSLVLALGVVAGSGSPRRRVLSQSVHRGLALSAVALVAAHLGTVLIGQHVPVDLLDVVLPFTSSFHRLPKGLGALATDLLVAVAVSSGLRHRLGRRSWRAVHGTTYLLWPVAALHGLAAGPDLGGLRWVTVACGGLVAGALGWRLLQRAAPAARAAAVGLLAAGLGVAAGAMT